MRLISFLLLLLCSVVALDGSSGYDDRELKSNIDELAERFTGPKVYFANGLIGGKIITAPCSFNRYCREADEKEDEFDASFQFKEIMPNGEESFSNVEIPVVFKSPSNEFNIVEVKTARVREFTPGPLRALSFENNPTLCTTFLLPLLERCCEEKEENKRNYFPKNDPYPISSVVKLYEDTRAKSQGDEDALITLLNETFKEQCRASKSKRQVKR